MINYRVELKISKKNDNTWSGGFFVGNQESNGMGEMYLLIKINTPVNDFSLDRLGKYVFDEIKEYFYFSDLNTSKSTLTRLEKTVWKMKSKLEVHLSKDEEIMEKGIDIEMAVIVIKNLALYGLVIGESQIILAQGETVAEISDVFEDVHQSGIFKTGSVKLTEDDVILLTTSVFYKNNEELLKNIAGNLDLVGLNKLDDLAGGTILLIADEQLEWNENNISENIALNEITENTFNQDENTNLKSEETSEKNENIQVSEEVEDKNNIDDLNKDVVDSDNSVVEEIYEDILDNNSNTVLKKDQFNSVLTLKVVLLDFIKSSFKNLKNKLDSLKNSNSNDLSVPIKTSEGEILLKNEDKSSIGLNNIKQKFLSIYSELKQKDTTFIYVIKSLVALFFKIYTFLVNLFKSEIIGVGGARKMNHQSRLKRNRLILAVSVFVLFVFGYINFQNIKYANEQATIKQLNKEKIEALESEYNNVSLQINSGNLSSNYIDKISNQLKSLQSKVENHKKDVTDEFLVRLDNLSQKITKNQDEIFLIEPFLTIPLIKDFSSVGTGVDLTDMEYVNGSIFITEKSNGVVYKLDTGLNSEPIVFVEGLVNPKLISKNATGNELVVIDESKDGAVSKFNSDTKDSLTRFSELSANEIGDIEEFSIYSGNDAMYEIHQRNQQIFKRSRLAEGYGGGGRVTIAGSQSVWSVDNIFTNAIDISAPFSIYVLSTTAGISRHTSGGKNEITQSTFTNLLPEDFNSLKNVSAIDVKADYLVVGDSSKKRVMVFNIKNQGTVIELYKQYVYRGQGELLNNIEEVNINTELGHIYVLDGKKVVRFAI